MKIITTIAAAIALVVPPQADAHVVAGCKKPRCKRHVVAPFDAHLNAIHRCEMRGRVGQWHYDGTFDGGLQFGLTSWRATGSPYSFAYQAPVLEQKYRAVLWARMIGWAWHSTAGWPVCG